MVAVPPPGGMTERRLSTLVVGLHHVNNTIVVQIIFEISNVNKNNSYKN